MKTRIILIIIILSIITILTKIKYDNSNTIKIDIGYQSVTSQTWGALVIKNKGMFESKLKEVYPNKKIKVVLHDEISGAVINTSMISGKVQFGFMGDMPLILNMYKADTIKDFDSKLIGMDGKGVNGKNQSILIPKNSNVKTIEELKGKTISTPIGSSAHYMLMKVLEKHNILDDVKIVHQDVSLSNQLLSTNKTDAFSIWAPYPNFLEKEGSGKVLVSGEESDIDYLAGVIVNNNYARKNKKIVKLFIESLDEAHKFIKENPREAAKIFAEESGFDLSITRKEVENIRWETTIEDKDINTLIDKQKFLIDLNQVKDFDLGNYIYR